MKKRVNIYLSKKHEKEIDYFVEKYGVSMARVVTVAYALADKLQLEKILSLSKDE